MPWQKSVDVHQNPAHTSPTHLSTHSYPTLISKKHHMLTSREKCGLDVFPAAELRKDSICTGEAAPSVEQRRFIAQQFASESIAVVQESPRDLKRRHIFIFDRMDFAAIEAQYLRARSPQENRRMRRHDKLRIGILPHRVVQQDKERKLTLRRQRSLWLIKQKQP